MKRPHEDGPLEEEPPAARPRLEKEGPPAETKILQDLQTNLLKGNLNATIDKRLFETQKQYFKVYMEKLLDKVHIGKQVLDVIRGTPGDHDFEYTFTAAKSVIHSEMRLQQIKAFHAVFDMVYSLMWRYVHEKMVTPTLRHVLSDAQLNLAFEKYQSCYRADQNGDVVEMQNLVYCIQEVLESQEPVKVSNPFHSRFTQQVKAMSEYVIALLVSLAKPVPATEEPTPSPVDPFESGSAPRAQWVTLDRPVSVVRAAGGRPSNPVSWMRVGERETLSVDPEAVEPTLVDPEAVDPEAVEPTLVSVVPETVSVEPESMLLEPENLVPEPESLVPVPESVVPEAVSVEPESMLLEPESVVPEPENMLVDPKSTVPEPQNKLLEPETVSAEPEPITAEPEAQTLSMETVVSVSPLEKEENRETVWDEFRGKGWGEKRDKGYAEIGLDGIRDFHSTSFMNMQTQDKKYSKDTKIKPRSNLKNKKKTDR